MKDYDKRLVARDLPAWTIRERHPYARVALIRAREARGLLRPELARLLNFSRGFVFNCEIGVRTPQLGDMWRWAKELGVSIEVFEPVPSAAEQKRRAAAKRAQSSVETAA
jgi:transcriptional regulator with XRE-family HTH domain